LKSIDVYEHGRLIIDEETFTREHWEAFVKLNTVHNGEYFDVLHNGLKFKQYVGVLQVDGLLVHIHPKADKDDSDSKWKGILLKMLKACGRVKAQATGTALLRKQNINLLEIYFDYYLSELEGLLHSGLVKKYRKETNNVKALKGKLEFAGNIRKNLVHQERFYTTHQVYDVNHKLHRVLAHALGIVGHFSRGTRLNDRCRRVELSFPEVDAILPTAAYLESIKLDRKTSIYERALELAKFIILNYSPDINQGQQKMIALLFDMNELWEEYVLKMLKKYSREYPDEGWQITGQESRLFYGAYRTIRPDIVLRRAEEVFILDTKWKRPPNKAASIEDLRQMYAYARFWKTNKVMLLYPGEPYDSGYKTYPNHHDHETDHHQCKIAMVNVLKDGILSDSLAEDILGLLGEENKIDTTYRKPI
jgi:5-methylcytosine-specific restriction enzyme subunit McrC